MVLFWLCAFYLFVYEKSTPECAIPNVYEGIMCSHWQPLTDECSQKVPEAPPFLFKGAEDMQLP